MARASGTKPIVENRRSRYDYELLDRFEAGIVLTGTEVKSLREGRVTLAQAYADLRGQEVFLIGAEIAEYGHGNLANHEATRDRKLLDRFEAGIVLTGTEVKSLREGRVTLAQAYADLRGQEVFLIGAEIAEYGHGNLANHEATRDRKLLLRREEISSLLGKVREKGLTLVPTRMYFKDGKVKVEIALARGKDKGDKRRTIADREAKRQMERALRTRR